MGGEWLELYPEPGRWRLSVPLEGTVGPVKVSHYLAQAAPVTALDVVGRYLPKGRTRLSSSREGPVRAVVLGIHQGFMRISVNYAPLRRPKFAAASVGCARERGAEVLVLELDFEEMEEAGQADKSLEGDDGAHGGESAESEEGGLTSGRGA